MGGKSKSTSTQEGITEEQRAGAAQDRAFALEDRAQRVALQQPAIDKNKQLASGDPSAVLQAIAPQLGTINRGFQAGKDSIFDSVAPGAARDFAMAGMERDKATSTAGFINEQVLGAPDKLANIGSGLGSFSLQELGASLRGREGASSSNSAIMEQETQKKAATMGFLGSLASGAGSAVGGGLAGRAPKPKFVGT